MEKEKIIQMRMRLDLSQERFAHLLGVSFQTVRRWESGINRPLPFISLKLEEIQRELDREQEKKEGKPMKESFKKSKQGILDVEIGLGGLFKGMGNLFDLVEKMVEEGKTEERQTASKDIMGGKGKAVYGFSVRVGLGGKPVIESFGNVRTTETGAVVAEVREPLVDVFDEGDEIRIIAEIPGVEEKSIKVEAKDDILTLSAEAGERKYQKEILLPHAVKPQVLERSYHNGVLELKLQKQ